MHNREAAKVRDGRKTRATEVSIGYRCEDGTTIMFGTASERALYRQQELDNQRLARRHAAERISAIVGQLTPDVDSWAHKS